MFTLGCVAMVSIASAETALQKGYKIMKAVDRLPTFEKVYMENMFQIYDAQGKLLFVKKARSAAFSTNFRDPDTRLKKAISYFYAPADDKGNGALNIELADSEDDDQWLYLKGLRKPKRIIGSDKGSSYMGSDFSNGDMSSTDVEDYHFTWLGEETVNFKGKKIKTQKIQTQFKSDQKREDYGYSKVVIWVHPTSGLTFKMDFYNLEGQLFKKGKLLAFKVLKNKDGKRVFMQTSAEMKNLIKGTKTVIQIPRIKPEKAAGKISSKIFSLKYLTRRWW